MKSVKILLSLCVFIFSLSTTIQTFADKKDTSSLFNEEEALSSLGIIKKEIPDYWWKNKDWDKTDELKELISQYPECKKACAEARFWIACNLYAQRKHEEAIKEYESILESCSREWDVCARSQFEIAQIYLFRLSKSDKALEAYMKTLDLTNEKSTIHAEVYRMIAVVYKRAGLYQSASFTYNKGLEMISDHLINNPADQNAIRIKYEMLWRIFLDLNKEEKHEESIDVLKQINEMEGLKESIRHYAAMNIANIHKNAGRHEKALEWYNSVLSQESISGMTYAMVVFDLYEIDPETLTDDKIDKLLELTKDENAPAYVYALNTLCYTAVPRTLDRLLEILENSDDEDTRITILSYLGAFYDERIKPILFSYLDSEKPNLRIQASTSLLFFFEKEKIKDLSDVTALLKALKNEDKTVKVNASHCLYYIENERKLLKPLKKALKDKDPFVKKAVQEALDSQKEEMEKTDQAPQ